MNNKLLLDNLRSIPDWPIKGVNFRDVTTLFKNAECLKTIADEMYDLYKDKGITKVVGIESRGFVMSSAIAIKLNAGIALCRKPGKLPYDVESIEYDLEYGTDTLEIHKDAIKPGQRVAIVDDLLATGGTTAAATKLIEKLGGQVVSLEFLIELTFLNGRDKLKGYDVQTLVQYDSE